MSCFQIPGELPSAYGGGGAIAFRRALLVCDTPDNTWNIDQTDYGKAVYAEWTHNLNLPAPEACMLTLQGFFYDPIEQPSPGCIIMPTVDYINKDKLRIYSTNTGYGSKFEHNIPSKSTWHPAFVATIERLTNKNAAPIISYSALRTLEGIYPP